MPTKHRYSTEEWQQQVGDWVRSRFGTASLFDVTERVARVIEETCELAQAADIPKALIEHIAAHVYERPAGSLRQEAAGLVVTLLAFAHAHGFDLLTETRREIDRILSVPAEVSRQKQAIKAQAGIARVAAAGFRKRNLRLPVLVDEEGSRPSTNASPFPIGRITMNRIDTAQQLVDRTAAIENGLKVPANPPRYVALEQDLFSNTIWAYFEDTLDAIRDALEKSDTSHVDRIKVHDLDTGHVYLPAWKIAELVEVAE